MAKGRAAKAADASKSRAKPVEGRSLKSLPPWISAFAAITGTIISAIGVFNLVGEPTSTSPEVRLESVLTGPELVEGRGSFANVNPQVNEVLFIGRPSGGTEFWLAVDATLEPVTQRGPLQSGRWAAFRPSPADVAYRWYAILWPASAGAAGNEDLRINGPDSQFVVTKSEPFDTP